MLSPARTAAGRRWVYGDGAFYGPYVGPGNYGAPGKHYNMTPSWFWWAY